MFSQINLVRLGTSSLRSIKGPETGLYMGAITMALAYGLLYAGLRTTASSTAVIAILLEPVTAAVVATLFLGEVLRPAGIVGGVFILLALAGSGRAQRGPLEMPH